MYMYVCTEYVHVCLYAGILYVCICTMNARKYVRSTVCIVEIIFMELLINVCYDYVKIF